VGRVEYHRPVVESQPVRLAPRPAVLAGREGLLADLDARLSGGAGAGPRVAVLCGLGGAGKTSVAVEYAHRHLAEFGVVWQFVAEPAALAAGFSELAAQLGVRDLLDAGDPVARVHGALAGRPGGWLLVFDNVTDLAAVHAVLPPAGNGRVLITSQNQHWPTGQALNVPVLDQETAAAFLVNRTGATDNEAASGLAGELGGLPLALEQAAAYMQATGRGITEYLALFRARSADLLARGEPAGYDKRVTTTWALAFDQLQHTSPAAIGLLRLLACCAPEAIPLSVLLRPRPGLEDSFGPDVVPLLVPLLEDPLAADDAIAALRQYSLISAPHESTVSVHRLVQAVTLARLPDELAAAWRHAAASLIEAALPGDPEQAAAWPIWVALLPHAQAALTADSGGMARIATYLAVIGNYNTARVFQQQALKARERMLGAEHPDTLRTRGNIARSTGQAGNAVAACDLFAALLPVEERILGPEHPDTLRTRGDLAYWTGQAGDPAAARNQVASLLPVERRVLGAEHPITLAARGNLARWTGKAGDAAAARDQVAALLPVEERVLGPEHPATLRTRGNLAAWTAEAGDAVAARDQFAALLPVEERVLGPEHPDTLRTRHNLAAWTGETGDAVAARDQFATLLPVEERVLGAAHPYTLTTRDNLARWTEEAQNAARDQVAALPLTEERELGAEQPPPL
jgi:hypothetical protein